MNYQRRIAKLIGEPINPSLPVPVEISELAFTDTADPGEDVYRYDSYDTDADQILDVDTTNANITAVKRSPMDKTVLTFKGLDSQLEYVHVHDVLNSPDQKVLGRKKRRILAGMDKLELRCILNAIVDGKTPGMVGGTHSMEDSVQSVTPESGDDLYDLIMKAKHLLENYGDDYLLMNGSTVNEKLDTFDKDKAGTFNYSVTIRSMLKQVGIKPFKIFGTVKWTGGGHNVGSGGYADDSSATALLNANYFVLEARNSRIVEDGQIQKPIIFVRKKISAEIAEFMGAEVDKAQRALIISGVPLPVGTKQKLAYSVYGVEEIIWAIVNAYALVKSGDISSYL